MLIQLSLLLVVVIGLVCFAVLHREDDLSEEELKASGVDGVGGDAVQAISVSEAESFAFDPNTADSASLMRLGLSSYQVRNLLRYRAKGGVYHRTEEFKKLYGLTVEQWNHLAPLIQIGESYRYLADTPEAYNADAYARGGRNFHDEAHTSTDTASYERASGRPYQGARRDTMLYPNKLRAGETLDLNLADTSALKRIPGIGSYFAQKIVQYRERLGGFVSLRQLDDLDNIPLGVEEYLTLGDKGPHRLKVNHCTLRQLNAHPYISYYQARTIADHIRQFGPLRSINDLSLYQDFAPEDLQRLEPYLDFSM